MKIVYQIVNILKRRVKVVTVKKKKVEVILVCSETPMKKILQMMRTMRILAEVQRRRARKILGREKLETIRKFIAYFS